MSVGEETEKGIIDRQKRGSGLNSEGKEIGRRKKTKEINRVRRSSVYRIRSCVEGKNCLYCGRKVWLNSEKESFRQNGVQTR